MHIGFKGRFNENFINKYIFKQRQKDSFYGEIAVLFLSLKKFWMKNNYINDKFLNKNINLFWYSWRKIVKIYIIYSIINAVIK